VSIAAIAKPCNAYALTPSILLLDAYALTPSILLLDALALTPSTIIRHTLLVCTLLVYLGFGVLAH
jgi:hypothetical protein